MGELVISPDVQTNGLSGMYFTGSFKTETLITSSGGETDLVLGELIIPQTVSASMVYQVYGWAHVGQVTEPYIDAMMLGGTGKRLEDGTVEAYSTFFEDVGGVGGTLNNFIISANQNTPEAGLTTVQMKADNSGYSDNAIRTVLNWALTEMPFALTGALPNP
jgi:hypothetical protein